MPARKLNKTLSVIIARIDKFGTEYTILKGVLLDQKASTEI